MRDYSQINKKWWDSATPVHASSKFYGLESFKKGKTSLQSIEIQELGNVKGKTMLHLLCHFGMDSLSWARRGALVTGVDISESSIKLAKKLSREIETPAKFICSDVNSLPEVLNQKFDIVFASYGVLLWISNLKKFAKLVKQYITDEGFFYIVDTHPFTNMLSFDFKFEYKYFDRGPYFDESGTYADWNENVKGGAYLWNHTMSDIVNAFVSQGLKIEYLHEFPFSTYDQFEGLMVKNKKGQYVLKDKKNQIPLLFSLKATR